MGHVPVRTCVACRRRRPQHELVRIALTREGARADAQGMSPGRGAYVCPDPECVETASRRGAQRLRRALRGGSEADAVAALAQIAATVGTGEERGR